MMKRPSTILIALATVITGLAVALASPARGYALQTGTNLVDLMNAFNAAYNAGDIAALRSMVDPAFERVVAPGTPQEQHQSFNDFFKPPFAHVEGSNIVQTGPDTVELDLTITGPGIPPTAHPFMMHSVVTFKNGKILRLVDNVTPQTAQDLAALGPAPGMPTTGAGNASAVPWLTMLGLLCLLTGVLTRRAYRRSR